MTLTRSAGKIRVQSGWNQRRYLPRSAHAGYLESMASDNKHGNKATAGRASALTPSISDTTIKGFLDYLRVEKGLAPLTVSSYRTDLVQFGEFLQGRRRTL